jgi:hypothetical protein
VLIEVSTGFISLPTDGLLRLVERVKKAGLKARAPGAASKILLGDVAAEDTLRSPNWSRRLPRSKSAAWQNAYPSRQLYRSRRRSDAARIAPTWNLCRGCRNADQWHGPVYRYVKVKGDDGGLYILRFEEGKAVWDLTLFESERARALRGLNRDPERPQGPQPCHSVTLCSRRKARHFWIMLLLVSGAADHEMILRRAWP